MESPSTMAGRMERCPACGKLQAVPAQEGGVPVPLAPAVKAAPPLPTTTSTTSLQPFLRRSALPPEEVSLQNLRSRYWWLYIPLISWLFLVFPLVLPPIPLGPIAISVAWNRREWMPFLKKGMACIGRQRKQNGFPLGWFVNFLANLLDMATLGLSTLFVTAELLGAVISRHGTQEERMQTSPILWVMKWLLLGNVVFLAVYISCPGFIYEKLLIRLETVLSRQAASVGGAAIA
jgi:hypothetical protein